MFWKSLVVAFLVARALRTLRDIGQPRNPITAREALWDGLVTAVVVTFIFIEWH